MAQGAPGRLVAEMRRTPARACNIVATLPGRSGAGSPLVVMTPTFETGSCCNDRPPE